LPPHQAVLEINHQTYELDGSLSGALRPGPWRQVGAKDGYSLFVRTHRPTPVYAVAQAGRTAPAVEVRTSGANAASIRLHASAPVAVVRDVAWDGGWQAWVSVNGGPARQISVAHHGLVQQVTVPAGRDVVTFRYRPPHLVLAAGLSLGAVVVLVALGAVALWRRARRRAAGKVPLQQ
jgi:hypothetical protein